MSRKPVPDEVVQRIIDRTAFEFGYAKPGWTRWECERYVRWDIARRGYDVLHYEHLPSWEAFYAIAGPSC